MSITNVSSDPADEKQPHKRSDSCELDVFEATKYFSGFDGASLHGSAAAHGDIAEPEPVRKTIKLHMIPASQQINARKADKKHRQPSSPGRRLASFLLNALFGQEGSKQKTSKATTLQRGHEDEKRKKRRSSMGQFQSSTESTVKSLFSSSASGGFKTPPVFVNTSTRRLTDFMSYSVISMNGSLKSTISLRKSDHGEKVKVFAELVKPSEERENSRDKIDESEIIDDEDDDGGDTESDSSSDLFELPLRENATSVGIKKTVPPSLDGKS